jgi:hypothetical protein
MTEQEWLDSGLHSPMVALARARRPWEVRKRKMRLLVCACCREVWDHLIHPHCRHAVEVAERYADGQATANDRDVARMTAVEVLRVGFRDGSLQGLTRLAAPLAVYAGVRTGELMAALDRAVSGLVSYRVRVALGVPFHPEIAGGWKERQAAERRRACDLVRDVFGNPFRLRVVQPSWLSWRGGFVGQMARAIYNERRFADLPILADALEEAGCDDADLLGHCRRPGGHARGCWALDLLPGW